jgi:signal transduction histidine kinase
MAVFATSGPFIYMYLQSHAEAHLRHEQRRYQDTLRQASSGMGRIKDLKRLLHLIVHVVTRAVRVEYSYVYLFNAQKKEYILGAYRRSVSEYNPLPALRADASLIHFLNRTQQPVIYEEIHQRIRDHQDNELIPVLTELQRLHATLVVPNFIDNRLLGFIVLGKKRSKELYTQDDLTVFTILANQAALAIENAMFYEDMKKTQAQLFKAEKMATIGTMADGLSHQINNRLHALGFIAGDALDTVTMKKDLPMSDECREVFIDIEHALVRIQENVAQGGEVVQGLLRYTRKGEEGFTEVDLDALITAAFEMAQFKIRTDDLELVRDYEKVPKIKGNFTQLQEVFFNLIDNAYDAMIQRRDELKEPGFQPTLVFRVEVHDNNKLTIRIQDNGIGVKKEDVEKLFTPFFTTKLSSKKGTGLGLYVIQKIIEDNHGGKVKFESEYQKGTLMSLTLPIFI